MINEALRVPSRVPGKWVYLRKWDPQYQGRSWASCPTVVTADLSGGEVFAAAVDGALESKWFSPPPMCSDWWEVARCMDEHLTSLGAEPVSRGEWPIHCLGVGYREDRPPFTASEEEVTYLVERGLYK